MVGRGLNGVGRSSNSVFFITNTRRDNAAKMMSQLTSNPISVQARIICVPVKVEGVTFMDTSSFIKSFQEKSIACHYYSKTKGDEDLNFTAILLRKSVTSPPLFSSLPDICPFSVIFDLPPAGLEMRPDNAAPQLATAQSGRKEAVKKGKGFFGDTPNPGKGLRPLHSCSPGLKN
jgi:hypothetical protein